MARSSRVPSPIVIQIPSGLRPQRSTSTVRIKLIYYASVLLALSFLLLCLGFLSADSILWLFSLFLADEHAKQRAGTLIGYLIGIGIIGTVTNGLGVCAAAIENLLLTYCFAVSSLIILFTFLYFLFAISPWPFFLILVGMQTVLFVLAMWYASDLRKQANVGAPRERQIVQQSELRPQPTVATNINVTVPMPTSVPITTTSSPSVSTMAQSNPNSSLSGNAIAGSMSLPSELSLEDKPGTPPPPYSK